MTNLMTTVALAVKGKAMRFVSCEQGEVNIVTTVVLIGIAVALATVLGTGLNEIVGTLLNTVKGTATKAATPSY